MERFSSKEQPLLGYIRRSSIGSSSPKPSSSSVELDFNDVFGGPPRRSSLHDWQRTSGGGGESEEKAMVALSCDPWTGLSEKPVFGDDKVNPRRYPSEDFFDDIFKGGGGEERVSTPRKSTRNPFSPSPRARILSPGGRGGASGLETFQGSPSLLSLPSEMAKEVDFPAYKNDSYSDLDGLGIPKAVNAPLPKVTTLVIQVEEGGSGNGSWPYHQSPLSHQHSSPKDTNFCYMDTEDSCKKVSKSSEVADNGNQFHFSIYKWAGNGVPLSLPFRGRNDVSTKETRKADVIGSGLPSPVLQGVEFTSRNRDDRNLAADVSFLWDFEKREMNPVSSTPNLSETVTLSPKSQSEPKVPIGLPSKNLEKAVKSGFGATSGIISPVQEKPLTRNQSQKPELQPLHFLLKDETDSKVKKSESSKSIKPARDTNDSKKVKSQSEKKKTQPTKFSLKGSPSPSTSEGKPVKNKVNGKVIDFVKMFNQEPLLKTTSSETRHEDFSSCNLEDQTGAPATKVAQKKNVINTKNTKTLSNEPLKVDQVVKPVKPTTPVNTSAHKYSGTLSETLKTVTSTSSVLKVPVKPPTPVNTPTRNASDTSGRKDSEIPSQSGPIPDPNIAGGKTRSPEINFQVKELFPDQSKEPKAEDNQEEIKVSDAKVRQWSKGKEGNIRSLLSTLQNVLWPGSGWKPVPLVDIIEGNSVKKAYQKALLCLHPDKLQQKGAADHQKYIAEKVFDILQEAWIHFNSMSSF